MNALHQLRSFAYTVRRGKRIIGKLGGWVYEGLLATCLPLQDAEQHHWGGVSLPLLSNIETGAPCRYRSLHITKITITKSAAKQVMHSAKESNAVGLPLRIAIKDQASKGFHYQMGFDDQLDEGDEQVESQGVLVVLDKDSAIRANRMTLNFIEIEGVMEFIFINPNDPQYRPPAQSILD